MSSYFRDIESRYALFQSTIGLNLPLTEGSSVNNDDGVLHESFGSYQLVVASVVNDVNDTSLPGNGFATPGEVSLKKILYNSK